MKIQRALISVSDKTGLEELAKVLQEWGVELIASGGTAKFLTDQGFPVTPVEEVTGNPETFGGRLKTLSFELAGALLFRRDSKKDWEEARALKMNPIDLVVCNLYPFVQLAREGRTWEELVENIDIGGVTLIRAGAKNYASVAVLTEPTQYREFAQLLAVGQGSVDEGYRKKLAGTAYRHSARYDQAIATHWNGEGLRYGENPHQRGWVLGSEGLAGAVPLQGKALSWNNLLDSDGACRSCWDLHFLRPDEDAVVVVKHGNPCGAALGKGQAEVLAAAWEGDPVSAFGSILCFNSQLNGRSALWLKDKFVEVIIAPSFSSDARELLASKKNLRLMELAPRLFDSEEHSLRSIDGGYLLQEPDRFEDEDSTMEVVTEKKWSWEQVLLGAFGERVCRHLKSNAIALVRNKGGIHQLIGAGMGNPNRLVSTRQAIEKARENEMEDLGDCVLVSDAFFPFRDNVDQAHGEGIRYILQPGGSRRDAEVIAACNEHGVAMGFTGRRHFAH